MPSLAETLKGHRRAGHTITVFMPQYGLFSPQLERIKPPLNIDYPVIMAPCRWLPGLKAFRRICFRIGGGKNLWFPLRWILNMMVFLLFTAEITVVVLRWSRQKRQRPDIIYAHNQNSALAGYILKRLLHAPNVTRLYGTFLADLMQQPFVTLRYPVAAAGYRIPCNLLIVGNDGTRGDEVARKFNINPERFRFWQNGVDPPSAPPAISRAQFARNAPDNLRPDSIWICSCSRLSYWKRIDRILKALQVCRNAGGNAQILIAGEGPERSALKAMVDELSIASDVVWLGAMEHDRIWELMNICDIFMITNDVTNRCNPLYEAIYACLPIVSIIDRSTADLLSHDCNALLAPPDDIQQLGVHLLKLCNDPQLRRTLSAAQQKVAKTFWNWHERMVCEVRELEQLLH